MQTMAAASGASVAETSRLREYRRKRDFTRSGEPAPGKRRDGASKSIFVVQLHHARRRHYDFRLEVDGVLKSWAVPKGPSFDPKVKRLAVEVEDHPLEYATFEGDIPAGNYGAGHVDIFDHGTWACGGDVHAQLAKGHLQFELCGARLRGSWHLVRTQRAKRQPEWLLIKDADSYACNAEADDLLAVTNKVRKSRTAAHRSVLRKPSEKSLLRSIVDNVAGFPEAKKRRVPAGAFEPELARLAHAPPEGDDWVHEVKWDGYRLLATIVGGRPTLWSRNALEWTSRLPDIVTALSGLGLQAAQLDGELIVLRDGKSDFNALQAMLSGEDAASPVYVMFDLVHLNEYSLAGCPLVARKQSLRSVIDLRKSPHLRFSDHHVGDGGRVFAQAMEHGLEGVMSKRAASPYRGGRGDDWRKVKQAQSDEFAIVGYTAPKGSRAGFGSLLLASAEKGGSWRYAGRVGSGFSHAQLGNLEKELRRARRPQAIVRRETIDPLLRDAHWVEPEMVAEVYYRGIGNLGLLRQPSLKAIRADKSAADLVTAVAGVRRGESAMPTAKSKKASSAPDAASKPARRKIAAVASPSAAVKLSHPERVAFPADGYTKQEVADYYSAVMPWLLAGISNRPLSVVRCPDGIGDACFFQKHLTPGLTRVRSVRLTEENGKSGNYLFVDSAEAVMELVQFNALEFHPWAATARDPDHAQYLVFDLDPAPDVAWKRVVAAAIDARDLLAGIGLTSFVRTTGGKGLHVVVPLRPPSPWTQAKDFAHAFASSLAESRPDEFIAVATKNRRGGKIFVDYLRNTRGATSVASYSLRARPGAPVAVPLDWKELSRIRGGAAFDIRSVPKRLRRLRNDPWAGFDSVHQGLESIAGAERRRHQR
ncbi:MAG: DNA ligase D [Rudaea sp.]|nr:DNA ligase D [Rudaea sp.]